MRRLHGRVAIVTGAARGIGFAIARGSPGRVRDVVVADLAEASIRRRGRRRFRAPRPVVADVSLKADATRLVDDGRRRATAASTCS